MIPEVVLSADLPDLLTAHEVAAVLRVNVRWVYDATTGPKRCLRAIRISRSLRYPRGEVERYLRECMEGGDRAGAT